MSEVETGSCYGFIEWLFIILGTILAINIIDIAIFILWSLICFSIGRMFGRAEKLEREKEAYELYMGEFEEARSVEDCKDCQHFYFCYPDDMEYEDLTEPNLEMCIRKKEEKDNE